MLKSWLKPYIQGPRILQGCTYLIILLVLLTFVANRPADLAAWRFFGVVLALTGLLAVNLLWAFPASTLAPAPRQRRVPQWAFLLISSILILSVMGMSGQYDAAFLLAVLCMQASFRLGIWPAGVLFTLLNLTAWTGLLGILGTPLEVITIVLKAILPGLLFGLLLTVLLQRYAEQTRRAEDLLHELQAANAALETARRKETDLAVAEERVRLARDIHDGLGHHLTILSIQLQAAGKLVERSPGAAAEAIQVCRAETQAALDEVRHSVGIMREGAPERRALPETLSALAQSFARHAGIPVGFDCTGAVQVLPDFTRETLYRAAQEGLTNAQKHALDAHQVTVQLSYTADSIRLRVADDGHGSSTEAAPDPMGFGLAGLRERVARLGGSFQAGPGGAGGFVLELCIPIPGGQDDPRAAG